MKRLVSFLMTMVLLLSSAGVYVQAETNTFEDELDIIINLISTGEALPGTNNSVEMFDWVMKVKSYNDNHADNKFYTEISKECTTMLNSTYVSGDDKNRTVAYLKLNKLYGDGKQIPGIEELINVGKGLSGSNNSVDAFSWVLFIKELNKKFTETSVYSKINASCESMIKSTYISGDDISKTTVYLSTLAEELLDSIQLVKLKIAKSPKKTVYNEGDTFNPEGLVINAVYKYSYMDGSYLEKNDKISNYNVDTTTELKCDDSSWIIAYTEDGVTKTVAQDITVNPNLISEELKSIEIVSKPNKVNYLEGEMFDKTGMIVNATYNQVWSNGQHSLITKKAVPYVINANTKLSASDVSVTVTVNGGEISLSLKQPITVESYAISTELDSIIIANNPYKLTYYEGDKFDKSGLIVNARYKKTWSNGYVEYIIKENIAYNVNTTSPIVNETKSITVSFIDSGIIKKVEIPISVLEKQKNEADGQKSENQSVTDTSDKQNNEDGAKADNKTISKGVHINKVKAVKAQNKKGNKVIISFKNAKNAKGYQVQYSLNKKFSVSKKSLKTSKLNCVIKNLKKKKTYYFRIRGYQTRAGITVYGDWSAVTKIKIKR